MTCKTDQLKFCGPNKRLKWHRWITAVWKNGGCTICTTCMNIYRKNRK